MIKRIGLFILLFSISLLAQNASVNNKFGWDQIGTNLSVVQNYVYTYKDNGVMGTSLTGVICSGATSPFSCRGNFPNLTTGQHSLTLVAIDTTTLTPLESAESVTLKFEFRERPTAPQNLSIIP